MVDQESATYRPRRAYIEPDAEPAQPERPAQPGQNGIAPDRNGIWSDRNGIAPDQSGIAPDRNGAAPDRNGAGPARRMVTDEDYSKPLYRDDIVQNGRSRPGSRTIPLPQSDPPTEETMRPIAFAPRRPHQVDDESTTILPRSRPTKHRTQALDAIDDYDDDDERLPLGRRAKIALLIGAVAAVVVIGLVVGYGVVVANHPQTEPSVSPSGASSGTSGGGNQPPNTQTALLTNASMLSPGQAKGLDPSRKWKVSMTKSGASQDSNPACFGTEPVEGQPTPQQEIVRVLGSSGKEAPNVLHQATAYGSPEVASQAYAIASKTLGGCAVAGHYIESGNTVSGVGNQAVGVVVMQKDGKNTQAHSIVLSQTGRIMNVIDAVHQSDALPISAVAEALARVNTVQCGAAGGKCGGKPLIKDGPPPLGGDEPGFLASGDLPWAGRKVAPWVATAVELPRDDFQGSGCERTTWTTVKAKARSSRVYLIQESGKDFFGVNEIVLTEKDAKAARKLVDGIKSNLSGCKSLQLTATVTKPKKVTSIGAQNTKVAGWTSIVSQKSTKGTAKYRIGIVSAGSKVIYTFSNPVGDYDFTNHQWNTVAVRAGERTTQVN
jgi:hypothetical protein